MPIHDMYRGTYDIQINWDLMCRYADHKPFLRKMTDILVVNSCTVILSVQIQECVFLVSVAAAFRLLCIFD